METNYFLVPITNWHLNEHTLIQSFENLPKSRKYSVILIVPENTIKIKGPVMMGFYSLFK